MRQVAELLRVDESRISQLHAAVFVQLKANVDSLPHTLIGTATDKWRGSDVLTGLPRGSEHCRSHG